MANSEILNGKANIAVEARSGNVVARGGNYILTAQAADIANYAREGGDLVVEFVSGERLVMRDFFSGANNLVLSDGANMQLVDFSNAMGGVDGISDAAIAYDGIAAAGGANMALLGLLGLAAAGAGVAVAASGGSNNNDGTPSNGDDKNKAEEAAKEALGEKALDGISKLNDIFSQNEDLKHINDIKDIKDIKGLKAIAAIENINDIIKDISAGVDYIEDVTTVEDTKNTIKGLKALIAISTINDIIAATGGIEGVEGIDGLLADIRDGLDYIATTGDIEGLGDKLKEILEKLNTENPGNPDENPGNPDENPGNPDENPGNPDETPDEFNLSAYLDLGGNGELFTGEMMADIPAPANFSYIEEDFATSMAAASQIII